MMFKNSALIGAVVLSAATTVSAATIVYEDTFDNDGIAVNTGVGGGMSSLNSNGGSLHTDTGVLGAQTASGPRQSAAWTTDQFALTGGFELDVTFTTVATGNPSFTYGFGIVDEVVFDELKGFIIVDGTNNFIGYGAALRPTHATGKPSGLYTDFGTVTSVSTGLGASLGTTQTFNLVVNADGSGSATLGTVTETYAAGTFSGLFSGSTDGEYHFAVYA